MHDYREKVRPGTGRETGLGRVGGRVTKSRRLRRRMEQLPKGRREILKRKHVEPVSNFNISCGTFRTGRTRAPRGSTGRTRAPRGSHLSGSPVLSRRGAGPTRPRTICTCSWHPIHNFETGSSKKWMTSHALRQGPVFFPVTAAWAHFTSTIYVYLRIFVGCFADRRQAL
jgi:hypothetical protein